MTDVVASAPGKVILCGEYAVLEGASALCMAVNRRCIVRLQSASLEHSVVNAPGYTTAQGSFTTDEHGLSWLSGGDNFRMFERVWQVSRAPVDETFTISLDTSTFRDPGSGSKIGVGSSAALAVALAKALESLGGGDALAVARRAHREFQGGMGSGADIACSYTGGVVEYRMTEPVVHACSWPAGLHYAVFWSGVPASTKARVERLKKIGDMPSRRQLEGASNQCADVFRRGAAADFLDATREYCGALQLYDDEHGLDIFGGGHAALLAPAKSHGVVYKPCGAGGGDVGIALATSDESLASFSNDASVYGFHRLDMTIDLEGAVVSHQS